MKNHILTIAISVLVSTLIMSQLTFPLDETSKRILRDFMKNELPNLVLDSVWKDFFHYSTIFEGYADNAYPGQGGLSTFASAGASAGITPDGLFLSTGATNNNLAQVYRYPNPTFSGAITLPFLSWKKQSRFRANFAVSSVANQTAYIVAGLDPTTGSLPFYGFKIVNNSLYGVSRKDSSAEETVLITTISADTNYLVEARHFPDIHKVEFYIESSGVLSLQKTITTTSVVPDSSNTNHNGILFYSLQTNTTADKQLSSSYFEYIQKRDST